MYVRSCVFARAEQNGGDEPDADMLARLGLTVTANDDDDDDGDCCQGVCKRQKGASDPGNPGLELVFMNDQCIYCVLVQLLIFGHMDPEDVGELQWFSVVAYCYVVVITLRL